MAVLIEAAEARNGKRRVVFTINGQGPYVEFRPEKENPESFIAAYEAAQVPPEVPDEVEVFRAVVMATPADVVKAALSIDDAKLAAIAEPTRDKR